MNRPLHIAILNVFFAPNTYGGATVVAEEVGRRLVAEHGVQISAISAMARPDLQPYCVLRGEVDGMATWLINLPSDRSYVDGYLNPKVGEQVARILHEIEPDVAHVHCIQDLGANCMSVLAAAGIPTILSVHDFWWLCEHQFMLRLDGRYCGQNPIEIAACRGCVHDHNRARIRQTTLLELADRAQIVTYPSQFARQLCEGSGLAPGRGVVWENGVRLPAPDFFERQARRRAEDPRLTFGFVGGPSRLKGWPIIFDTFAGLPRNDFKGLVVEGSPDGSWWRDRSLGALSGEWAVFPRYTQAGMDDFFAQIDVLLFMSQWKETYGLTIREAIARGIHVVQTSSGGTVEHAGVRPEWLLQLGDGPEVLRPKIEQLLEDGPPPSRPIAVTSQSDQAQQLLDLAKGLVLGKITADADVVSRLKRSSAAA